MFKFYCKVITKVHLKGGFTGQNIFLSPWIQTHILILLTHIYLPSFLTGIWISPIDHFVPIISQFIKIPCVWLSPLWPPATSPRSCSPNREAVKLRCRKDKQGIWFQRILVTYFNAAAAPALFFQGNVGFLRFPDSIKPRSYFRFS